MVPAFVGTPDEAADTWAAAAPDNRIAVIGDAWPEASAALLARFGDALEPVAAPPLAEVLALEAGRRVTEAVVPAAVRPAYVRRPDAVLTRLQAGLPVTRRRRMISPVMVREAGTRGVSRSRRARERLLRRAVVDRGGAMRCSTMD